MRMRKEIFDNEQFSKMADTTVVLVNADFPRNKNNQLDESIKAQNELLADKYDPEGKFPFTLLIASDGKVLKTWEGFQSETVGQFIKQVKDICDANK